MNNYKIGIVGCNYHPEKTGIGPYTTGLAEFLNSANDVLVYTGFTYYPKWSKSVDDRNKLFRNDNINGISVYRSYLYVPNKPSALKRIFHEFSFVMSVSLRYLFSRRNQFVIVVMPPLFLALPIILISILKRTKVILHVQDLQPDAAVDLGMLKPGFFTSVLYKLESISYKLADYVSTISVGMQNRIIDKGVPKEKMLLFRNWANDDQVKNISTDTEYRKQLKLDDKVIVLYSGNMGVKQGLDIIIDIANTLRDHSNIHFLVVGDGGEKDKIVARSVELQLTNIDFLELQPFERLGELLATADISIIPQRKEVKDIVLPSKLGNILSSSRPVVVAAHDDSELGKIVSQSNCGIRVEPESLEGFTEAILKLANDKELRDNMGENGQNYVSNNLAKNIILQKFSDEALV